MRSSPIPASTGTWRTNTPTWWPPSKRAYDRWWADISTDFDKPARIVIGSDRANPTALNSHDWIGEPSELFAQSQIRRGRTREGNLEFRGHWMIEVARDGRYEIEFRRWPRELNRPITAGIEGGGALSATEARLMIAGMQQTLPVAPDAVAVTFSVDLKAGPATLEGRFIDGASGNWRSPFYVYVRRVAPAPGGGLEMKPRSRETYWRPSLTSDQMLGGPFRFAADKRRGPR